MRRSLPLLLLLAACGRESSVPAPRAPAAANCAGSVPWSEAIEHVGREVTVEGPVMGAKYARSSRKKPTFINIGRPYPDKKRFTVVIFEDARRAFPKAPEKLYGGKRLCAKGVVELYGGSPQIVVESPDQLQAFDAPVSAARVVDGDTIVLSNGERVRYIGIDTPETTPPAQCFGPEAAEANRRLVEGRAVELTSEGRNKDSHGRLLRHIQVDGVDVEAALLRDGFAVSLAKRFPHSKGSEYDALEREAREAGRGLWSACRARR